MAKNKGLHISKEELKKSICEFCGDNSGIKKEELKNQANQQHRIYLEKDGQEFFIDVFYNKANTITVNAHNGDILSNQLCQFIKDGVKYKDVPKGQFSCDISEENFNLLVEYLEQLEGVTLNEKADRGDNGYQVVFTSDIGDHISLTFYRTRSRMSFQGCFIKLYTEVKCFIGTFANISNITKSSMQLKNEKKVEQLLEKYLPDSNDIIDEMQKDLIYDSIAQMVCKPLTKDYSIWTFSILKALEARIKHIFNNNGITIHDERGFALKIGKNKIPMFNFDQASKLYSVNDGIIPITDANTLDELEKMYNYFKQNRDSLFHTRQVGATRKLATEIEAENIIIKTCDLINGSYKILGK